MYEIPLQSCRKAGRIAERRCAGDVERCSNQTRRLNSTYSVQIWTSDSSTSTPYSLTTFGCCSSLSDEYSRKRLVGTPSSLPAFVVSRWIVRKSTASFVPRSAHLNSLPLLRRSTIFSSVRSCFGSGSILRKTAQSSGLLVMRPHDCETPALRTTSRGARLVNKVLITSSGRELIASLPPALRRAGAGTARPLVEPVRFARFVRSARGPVLPPAEPALRVPTIAGA